MSIQPVNQPAYVNGTGLLLPSKSPLPPIIAEVPRDLPCYTILVHGVNDLGETYGAQEQGLCDGLNQRLDRCDLHPATYKMPSVTRDDKLEDDPNDDPDARFFQRTIPKGLNRS